jgi:potassium efflux system protein
MLEIHHALRACVAAALLTMAMALIPATAAFSQDGNPNGTQTQASPAISPPESSADSSAESPTESPKTPESTSDANGAPTGNEVSEPANPPTNQPANDDAPQPVPADSTTPIDAQPAGLAGTIEQDQQTIRGFDLITKQVGAALSREGMTDSQISGLRSELDPLRNELPAIITRLQTRLSEVDARLNQLGPAPEEGAAPEAEGVAQQRQQLEQSKTTVSGAISQARLLLVEADQIASRIAERRRDRFTATLAERTYSIVDPALWTSAAPLAIPAFERLALLFAESGRATANRLDEALRSASPAGLGQFALLLGALALSIGLLIWGHRFLTSEIAYRNDAQQTEDRLTRLTFAVWSLVVQGFLPLIALTITLFAMNWLDIFPSRFERLTGGIAVGVGLFFFVRALAFAILRPDAFALRLVAVDSAKASTLTTILVALGTVIGIDAVLNTAFDVVSAQLDLEVARSAVFALIVALLLLMLLRATTAPASNKDRQNVSEAESTAADGDRSNGSDSATPVPEPGLSVGVKLWARMALWLSLAVIIGTALGGYIALSAYVAGQVIFAGAVLATLYLLLCLADDISAVILAPDSETGNRLARAAGFKRSAMDQIVVLGGGAVRLTMIIVAVILVLMPWGFETREWAAWIRRAFFGFEVGEITISLSAILSALVLFAVGYAITRAVQNWLDNRFLPRTELDVGLKTSIRTGLGYVGIVAAAAFAVSFVGLDLANLAIVAGALSVGIGFGLQSVVNNFVSGLILLAERPIKVGDWIEAGGEQGYVRRINVRSTEIQTFDRASVIVPNSDLISGVVKNMMHNGRLGRVKILIGVSYDSDIDQVRDLILDCATNHPLVLSYPEPKVHFLDFGASSLDLGLYAFIGDVDNSLSVSSELRYAILNRFREAGIEIPFPQRDLNISGAVKFEPPEGMMGAQWAATDAPQSETPSPKGKAPRKASRKPGQQS